MLSSAKPFTPKITTDAKPFTPKITTEAKPFTPKISTEAKPFTPKISTEAKPFTPKITTDAKPFTPKITTEAKPFTPKISTEAKPFTPKPPAPNHPAPKPPAPNSSIAKNTCWEKPLKSKKSDAKPNCWSADSKGSKSLMSKKPKESSGYKSVKSYQTSLRSKQSKQSNQPIPTNAPTSKQPIPTNAPTSKQLFRSYRSGSSDSLEPFTGSHKVTKTFQIGSVEVVETHSKVEICFYGRAHTYSFNDTVLEILLLEDYSTETIYLETCECPSDPIAIEIFKRVEAEYQVVHSVYRIPPTLQEYFPGVDFVQVKDELIGKKTH